MLGHLLGMERRLLLRNGVENARRHLFEMSQKLGGGFERRGLKLFKRRAGKLFVCRVKPRAVDPGPIWRAGRAAGKTDEEIWADYDQAREAQA